MAGEVDKAARKSCGSRSLAHTSLMKRYQKQVEAWAVKKIRSLVRSPQEVVGAESSGSLEEVAPRDTKELVGEDTVPSREQECMRLEGRKRKREALVDDGAAHIGCTIDPEVEEVLAVSHILELERKEDRK